MAFLNQNSLTGAKDIIKRSREVRQLLRSLYSLHFLIVSDTYSTCGIFSVTVILMTNCVFQQDTVENNIFSKFPLKQTLL